MDRYKIAISAAAKVCGVRKSTILSPSREWPAVEARMIIVLLLAGDGCSDRTISWALNRKRGAILKSRHNAIATIQYSTSFREKFSKSKQLYEQKPI